MWINYNANPKHNRTGDCVIRALSVIMGESWEHIYTDLFYKGLVMKELSSSNNVWGAYLWEHGYTREAAPNTCPDCYTVNDFCRDHPHGDYILALDGHVVAAKDGNFYDTFDCGGETILYFWGKE